MKRVPTAWDDDDEEEEEKDDNNYDVDNSNNNTKKTNLEYDWNNSDIHDLVRDREEKREKENHLEDAGIQEKDSRNTNRQNNSNLTSESRSLDWSIPHPLDRSGSNVVTDLIGSDAHEYAAHMNQVMNRRILTNSKPNLTNIKLISSNQNNLSENSAANPNQTNSSLYTSQAQAQAQSQSQYSNRLRILQRQTNPKSSSFKLPHSNSVNSLDISDYSVVNNNGDEGEKSAEQREKEYEQARKLIFGDQHTIHDQTNHMGVNNNLNNINNYNNVNNNSNNNNINNNSLSRNRKGAAAGSVKQITYQNNPSSLHSLSPVHHHPHGYDISNNVSRLSTSASDEYLTSRTNTHSIINQWRNNSNNHANIGSISNNQYNKIAPNYNGNDVNHPIIAALLGDGLSAGKVRSPPSLTDNINNQSNYKTGHSNTQKKREEFDRNREEFDRNRKDFVRSPPPDQHTHYTAPYTTTSANSNTDSISNTSSIIERMKSPPVSHHNDRYENAKSHFIGKVSSSSALVMTDEEFPALNSTKRQQR